MTKEEFLPQLERAALVTSHLPVTSSLLKYAADQLRRGNPPWWKETLKAWKDREFLEWTDAWWLFLSCVHFEVLSDAENPLNAYFPSCGGTPEADPSGAFAKFLASPKPSFFENLKDRHRRTYGEVWATLPQSLFPSSRGPRFGDVWTAVWYQPAFLFFWRRDLPFYLVEVNAGAGLNLAADLSWRDFNSDLIAARIGLDPKPLQLEDISDRRWLTACIPPDQMPLIQVLDQDIDKVLERQRREAAFVQLVECRPELAPKFAAKNIPPEKDCGLMLFNMGVTAKMTDRAYEAYKSDVLELMKGWGERAVWLELEKIRGEVFSTTYQLKAARFVEGRLQEHVISRADMTASQISLQNFRTATDRFFAPPASPKAKA